jgi:hypothetical protein
MVNVMDDKLHRLIETYARRRHVLLPTQMDAAAAKAMAAIHQERGEWRLFTGHESCKGLWEIHHYFDTVTALVFALIGRSFEQHLQTWVNRYGVGQSIFPHRDRARGDDAPAPASLTVCLVAPPPDNGGELVLAIDGDEC